MFTPMVVQITTQRPGEGLGGHVGQTLELWNHCLANAYTSLLGWRCDVDDQVRM